MGWIERAAWFAACASVLAILVSDVSRASERASAGDSIFWSGEITRILSFLESEETKDGFEEGIRDRISREQNALESYVREVGGQALFETALGMLETGNDKERLRAQLILQKFEDIPGPVLRRLAKSESREQRMWSQLAGNGEIDKYTLTNDSELLRRLPEGVPDPFIQVADEYRRMISIPEEELEPRNFPEGYLESYIETFLPLMPEFWRAIPWDARRLVDFAGDGIDELVTLVDFPAGWGRGRRVFSILQRDSQEGPWKVAYLTVHDQALSDPRYVLADFDADGLPELVMSGMLIGGWVWEQMWIFNEHSLEKPLELTARAVFALQDPQTGQAQFVEMSAYNPTGGGKAGYLTTAIGSVCHVHQLGSGRDSELVRVYTRKSAW